MNTNLKGIYHKVDLCVVGGGLAGMCAAVAAARHGIKVALMHDRPVYGGNASSEIRMWVCGAHGKNNRETGIIEEIALETLYRNPYRRYPMWDAILFELINNEKNITPILNCSCNDIEMDGSKIKKVIFWENIVNHTIDQLEELAENITSFRPEEYSDRLFLLRLREETLTEEQL